MDGYIMCEICTTNQRKSLPYDCEQRQRNVSNLYAHDLLSTPVPFLVGVEWTKNSRGRKLTSGTSLEVSPRDKFVSRI